MLKLCPQSLCKLHSEGLHSRKKNCCVDCALENVEHLDFPERLKSAGLREKEKESLVTSPIITSMVSFTSSPKSQLLTDVIWDPKT